MGKQIIKVARDQDLYVEWDSVAEAPTRVGTRRDFAAYLNQPRRGEYWPRPEEIEQRLQRADETGTSGFPPWGCTWDRRGLLYQQQGVLPRARLGAFAQRLLADVDAEPDGLLEPLER